MKLDKSFQAVLERGTHKGSWTRVVMPGSAEFFATRGPVKIKAAIDNYPTEGSFIPVVTAHTCFQ